MRDEEIRVQDLYEGAFLLSRGFRLKDLELSANGKKTVTFVIAGEGVCAAGAEFESGAAMANVALLRFTLEKLKDRMFAKLRDREEEEKRWHARKSPHPPCPTRPGAIGS